MKNRYNSPATELMQLDSPYLMQQAASPAEGGTTYIPFTHSTTTTNQW